MKESDIRPQELFNRYLELARQDVAQFFQDTSQFVPVRCPACASADAKPGLEKLGFTYVLCAECGSLYVSPRPRPDLLDTYYREAESVRFWSTHFYKETYAARREKIFKPRAQLIGEWAARRAMGSAAVFADIGAGYGVLLEEIQQLGCFKTITGIEPNPELAEICRGRGFPIIEKTLESVRDGEVQTDFATAFEVLEHVFDPLQFLTAARRLLKPGGVLLFTTLTVSGFDIQVLWEHAKAVYPPYHINLLSVRGMERLVERAGLNLVELSTPGQLDVDIIANTHKENPDIRLPRFVSALLDGGDETARQDFQRFLAAHRLSSHIRVLASA